MVSIIIILFQNQTIHMSLLHSLIGILDLKKTNDLEFEGSSLDIGSPNIYGGQVLGQAIAAAYQTVEPSKHIHSLHSYFIRPGNIDLPLQFSVEIIKDGRSFDVRRVLVRQKEKNIFILSASFHIPEKGLEHSIPMPNVAQPESLSSFPEIFSQLASQFNIKPRGIFSDASPIIFHPVEFYDPFNPGIRPALNHTWMKPNGEFKETRGLDQSLLAYSSDFNLLITALFPHNLSLFKDPMQIASLDHSMWFHEDFDWKDWMLYVVEGQIASGARALCTGKIFSRNGRLIASVMQEGLIRKL